MKVNKITELIGNTPILNISHLFAEAITKNITVWIKLERSNPGGSIKDRIALGMVNNALKEGTINRDTHLIEPTSGNTGIGLALVCATLNLKLTLVMPESMSIERRKLIQAYGAKIVLTPKAEGMKGSIVKATELVKEEQNSWMPMQFENMVNPDTHYQSTAAEIYKDLGDELDYLITGVGTGGHISGCAKFLKEKNPKIKVIAVEPEDSPFISNQTAGPHTIQGIGAGFIPKTLNRSILDGVLLASNQGSVDYAQKAAKEAGLFCGISTGASLFAIDKKIKELKGGETILTFNYDTGERYLSVENFI